MRVLFVGGSLHGSTASYDQQYCLICHRGSTARRESYHKAGRVKAGAKSFVAFTYDGCLSLESWELDERVASALRKALECLDDDSTLSLSTQGAVPSIGILRFSFEDVLSYFRSSGHATARRESWQQGVFIYLVEGSSFAVSRPPLNKHFAEGTSIQYKPHIDMCSGNNVTGVYTPSQDDLFAEDWAMSTSSAT